MKKLLVTLAASVAFMSILFAAENTVSVDNLEIQEYQGVLGKWVNPSAPRFKDLMKEYGCDEKKFKELNPNYGGRNSHPFVFLPYSAEYLAQLEGKGIKRRIIESNQEEFIWPICTIDRITSLLGQRWGEFHTGVDLAAGSGTPIVAALDGKVTFAKYTGGYGNCVMIEHRNSIQTIYGHCSVMYVKPGDFVKKGQLIALVGNTGRSTGARLHFEIRLNDIPLDPMDFFPEDNETKAVVEKASKVFGR